MSNPYECNNLKSKHEDLCSVLNVDRVAMKKSWESYVAISENYTLDVSSKPLYLTTIVF